MPNATEDRFGPGGDGQQCQDEQAFQQHRGKACVIQCVSWDSSSSVTRPAGRFVTGRRLYRRRSLAWIVLRWGQLPNWVRRGGDGGSRALISAESSTPQPQCCRVGQETRRKRCSHIPAKRPVFPEQADLLAGAISTMNLRCCRTGLLMGRCKGGIVGSHDGAISVSMVFKYFNAGFAAYLTLIERRLGMSPVESGKIHGPTHLLVRLQ